DGFVCIRGRASDLINVAGRKVSPETIERAMQAHAGVRDCLVFGAPSPDAQRAEQIVACVVADPGVTDTELRNFLLKQLPAWQLPRDWCFVDSLAPNHRGKLSRAAWRARLGFDGGAAATLKPGMRRSHEAGRADLPVGLDARQRVPTKPMVRALGSGDGTRKTFIGVEIGGTKLQVVVGDESAAILERERRVVDRAKKSRGIRQQLEGALEGLLARCKPSAIGVGFGGPVDWRNGRIARSHHVEGWSGFGLSDWLHSLARVPVRVDNDANVAALGEASRGAGTGFDPVFYVTLGSGVGGGLVVEGAIYHGAKPGESELGHVRLDRDGTIVEDRCSGWAVDAKIRRLKESGNRGALCRALGGERGGESKHLA